MAKKKTKDKKEADKKGEKSDIEYDESIYLQPEEFDEEEQMEMIETKSDDIEDISEEGVEDLTDKRNKNLISSKTEIKLFNRWSFLDLQVDDTSLVRYINLEPIIIPHSGGKHEHKRFWKTERVSIVERFINKLLAPGLIGRRIKGRHAGLNAGKKQKVLKIIENSFNIIEETTSQNPIQVFIDAIQNSAPREETTRISLGGISYQTAVDISPQRRVDLGIKLLVQASVGSTYNDLKTIDECIAYELITASAKSQNSKAVRRRDEIERIAISAR